MNYLQALAEIADKLTSDINENAKLKIENAKLREAANLAIVFLRNRHDLICGNNISFNLHSRNEIIKILNSALEKAV